MRTTVDIPERLLRKAKAIAALEGKKLKDVVNEALAMRVETGLSAAATSAETIEPGLPRNAEWSQVGRFRIPVIRSRMPGSMTPTPEDLKRSETEEDEDRHAAVFGR